MAAGLTDRRPLSDDLPGLPAERALPLIVPSWSERQLPTIAVARATLKLIGSGHPGLGVPAHTFHAPTLLATSHRRVSCPSSRLAIVSTRAMVSRAHPRAPRSSRRS